MKISFAIQRRLLPAKPSTESLKEEFLWKICTACWEFDPQLRISAKKVVERLLPEINDPIDTVLQSLKFCDISASVYGIEERPFSCGGYGDVYKGKFKRFDRTVANVVIKRARVMTLKDQTFRKVTGCSHVLLSLLSILKAFCKGNTFLVKARTRERSQIRRIYSGKRQSCNCTRVCGGRNSCSLRQAQSNLRSAANCIYRFPYQISDQTDMSLRDLE